jgi:hypothetical protein
MNPEIEAAKAIRRLEDCSDSYKFAELVAKGIMMIEEARE